MVSDQFFPDSCLAQRIEITYCYGWKVNLVFINNLRKDLAKQEKRLRIFEDDTESIMVATLMLPRRQNGKAASHVANPRAAGVNWWL